MKKTVYAIIACIIIAGIAITVFMGLNFGLRYTANKQLNINIGKKFDDNELKEIVRDVLEDKNAKVIVQKVEIYEDIASIIVEDMSDEQVEELNKRINEKYEIENKVEDITIQNNSKLRGRDLVIPYMWPGLISLVLILVYAAIMYRRLGSLKVMIKVLGVSVIAQLVYLGLLAITRLSITSATVPVALAIYVVSLTVIILKLEKDNKTLLEKQK